MTTQYLGIKPRHSRGHDPDQFARRMVEHMNRSGLTAKLIKPLNEDETHGFEVRGSRDTAHLADTYFDAMDHAAKRVEGAPVTAKTSPTRQELEHMLRKSLRYQRLRAGLGGGLMSALLSGGLTAGMNTGHPDQWTTAAQMAGLGAAVGGGSGYFGTKGEQRATNYRVRNDATGEIHRFRGNKLASDRSDMLSWIESRLVKQAVHHVRHHQET